MGFQERSALDHHHVGALFDQHAGVDALVLAQAGRLLAVEAHAGADLVADHFRRDRRELAGDALGADLHFGRHAQAKVLGVAFGHLELDFQFAQVDHGEQRGVGDHHGAVGHRQRADHALDRRAHIQLVDPALEIGDQQALALQRLLAGLQFEADRLRFELRVGGGVAGQDLRALAGVLRPQVLDLGQRAELVRALGALQLALGGGELQRRLVGGAPGQQLLLVGEDALARDLDLELRQHGLLAFVLVGQFRRVEHRQHLVAGDAVAGGDAQRHRSGVGRVQRRAVGRDHPAGRGDVTHQHPAAGLGGAQPVAVGGSVAAGEALQHEHGEQREAERGDRRQQPARQRAAGGGDRAVLGGGVADHRAGFRWGLPMGLHKACQRQVSVFTKRPRRPLASAGRPARNPPGRARAASAAARSSPPARR